MIRDVLSKSDAKDFHVALLRNGVFPKDRDEKGLVEIYAKQKDYSNQPLSFTELCTFNTWFNLYPEKVCGQEVVTTSREFPISIKGNGQPVQDSEPMASGSIAQYTVMAEDVEWAFMGIEITIGEETTFFFFVVDDQEPIAASETSASMVELIVTAAPTSAKVFVNGQIQEFQAYEINDYNYFKLRDIAQIITGTGKQFEVSWDGERNAISIDTGHPYTSQGGELAIEDNPEPQTGMAIHSTIYLDGQEISLVAYEIDNYNYFKLRDLGKTLNFAVNWDQASGSISIDTSAGYEE
jgi:hypothetical protein